MRRERQIPKRLGGYRLVRQLGRGGMAEVWLAYKEGDPLEKPWVIKVLLPEYVGSVRHRERFLSEVRTLASLRHGRIVPIHSYGEDQGFLYLVMEYIDGVNLKVFVRALEAKGERIPLEAVVYILADVADALRHAHDRTRAGAPRGVIHRDVKPSNVIISSEGEVYLTDFGLARYEQDFSYDMFGTPIFVAPEQARGAACPQSDVYGLGVLLHFMLTGEPPRKVSGPIVPDAVLDAPPPPTGRDDVPEQLELIRTLCLEPSLARRLESAIAVLRLIEKYPFRRCAMMLKEYHLRYFGPPRTGTTEALAMAKAAESAEPAPEAKAPDPEAELPAPETKPPPRTWAKEDADEDLTTFWQPPESDEGPSRHDHGLPAVPPEYRPTPGGRAEADAPRIRRRPRGDGSPGSPPPLERTEVLSPPFVVEPRPKAEARGYAVIEVEAVAGGEVELDGRRIALDPTGRAALPLGRYAVRWRATHADAWHDAGSVHIGPEDVAASSVHVRVSPSEGVRVERRP